MPEINHTFRTKNQRVVAVQGHADVVHRSEPVYKYFPSTPPASPAVRRTQRQRPTTTQTATQTTTRPSGPVDRSMIGLLTLTAIPTTIAVAEAISERDKAKNGKADSLKEARQLRKFGIRCYCAGSSAGKRDVHGGELLVGDGAVYVRSPSNKRRTSGLMPAESFYVEYPDPDRTPAVLGLVTKVRSDPPLLNWIYIDEKTHQVRHANRSGSITQWVGAFGSTDDFEAPEEGQDEEEDPSGITFDEVENFVVVQPQKGSKLEELGLWEVWWDVDDDKLKNGKKVDGRLVLRVSLERHFIEEEGA